MADPIGGAAPADAVVAFLAEDDDALRAWHRRHTGKLDFSNCELTTVPSSVFLAMGAVQILILDGNEAITSLPSALGEARELRTLSCMGTAITSLPETVVTLAKLEVLFLDDCEELQALPEDIGLLRELRELHCTGCALGSIPTSIGELTKLEELGIGDCGGVRVLPREIAGCKALRVLWAYNTGLESLPKELGLLPHLEEVDCNGVSFEDDELAAAVAAGSKDLADLLRSRVSGRSTKSSGSR